MSEVLAAERAFAFEDVLQVGSMLSHDERLLLHWATRAGNPSGDPVVDAGCFLGGSTLSLAAGVDARPDSLAASTVHVYDLFVFGDESERQWVPDDFAFGIGKSTLPVFEHQVQRVRRLLSLHPGDVRVQGWDGTPISVCFIDIAKSWDTGDAVHRRFLPALVPGSSLLIEQDLVHWGHPWCAITTELLADQLEYVGWVWYSSAVYRSRRKVAASDLPGSLLEELSTREMLDLLDRAATRFGEPIGGSVRLSGAAVLGSRGDYAGARRRVDEIRAHYTDDDVPYLSEGFAYLDAWIAGVESGAITVR